MKVPNVLVISHNCFSKRGSNGRTLANFFIGWPKKSLAQFYISNELPDSEVCNNYFRVTDVEVLKSFIKRAKVGQVIENNYHSNSIAKEGSDNSFNKLYKRSRKRTSLNYLIRNFIWDINKWRSEEFQQWIDKQNPDLVLLQLGDYAFMLRIALEISRDRKIPLIIYNSEDYYFKDKKSFSFFYQLSRHQYKRQVEKVMKYASHSIYNSEALQRTYSKKFQHESTVIMTSTEITPSPNKISNNPIIISYLGNLGVGRHTPLIEIANVIHGFDASLYLDVYGRAPNEEVRNLLEKCEGIRMKGFVTYDDVKKTMKESDVLVHAENFLEHYQRDLKHAFSTKVSDCLASGTCFFVYAPNNVASVRYLMEQKVACVVTNKEDLKESLRLILNDEDLRQSFINNALRIVNDNHNPKLNADKFKNLIVDVVKKVSENK